MTSCYYIGKVQQNPKSFVRGRMGVPAYQIWWLYTALHILYKQSPQIDRIVRNLQFSDAIFVSITAASSSLDCKQRPYTQVGVQIGARTKCRKPFVRLKQASGYQSDNSSIHVSFHISGTTYSTHKHRTSTAFSQGSTCLETTQQETTNFRTDRPIIDRMTLGSGVGVKIKIRLSQKQPLF